MRRELSGVAFDKPAEQRRAIFKTVAANFWPNGIQGDGGGLQSVAGIFIISLVSAMITLLFKRTSGEEFV